MINALTGLPISSAELFEQIAKDQAGLANTPVYKLSGRVNAIFRDQGKAEALKEWERETLGYATFAESQGHSPERQLVTKLHILVQMALRNPDDEWSGRGNEAKRVHNDGRRELLLTIEHQLQSELIGLGSS